jgi:hypothetical protein
MRVHSFVLLSVILGSATAQAQGLAEAAQKEKEKREAAKAKGSQAATPGAKPPEAKVYTGDDLKTYAPSKPAPAEGEAGEAGEPAESGATSDGAGGSVGSIDGSGPVPASPGGSSPSGAKSRSGPNDDSTARAGQESAWRSRSEAARSAVSSAEKELAAAEKAKSGLGVQPSGDDTPNPGAVQNQWRKSVEDADKRVKRAQTALDTAKQSVERLEEDARRQGVPPGWLR